MCLCQQSQSHEQRSLLGREHVVWLWFRVHAVLGDLGSPAPVPSRGPAPPSSLCTHPCRLSTTFDCRVFWAFVLAAKYAQSPTSSISDVSPWLLIVTRTGGKRWAMVPSPLSPWGHESLCGPSMSTAAWWLRWPGSSWAAHRGTGGLLPQTGSAPSRFRGPSLAVPWIPPACLHPPDTRGKWPLGKAGSVHLQIWYQQTSGQL